jgi:hypothetical protein
MGRSGRYELKYIIGESEARAVSSFVSHYLVPSKHNGSGPVPGHPVISLYLDSPDLALFRQGTGGNKNRIKLRIRIYDDEWDRPAFLEIKRRVSDVIIKGRAMMSRKGVREMLLAGWSGQTYWPDPSMLVHGRRRQDILGEFLGYCNQFHARGTIYVSYSREIFESVEDEELRVTLDHQIRGSLYDGSGRLTVPKRGWRLRPGQVLPYFPPDGVVLELKFEDQPPGWMHQLVQRFNLQRRAVCKYCACIDAVGLQWGRVVVPECEADWVP